MLSASLVHLVSDHWEEIASRVLRQVQRDSRLITLGALPESELRSRAREILQNLGAWLVAPEADLARRYEELGRQRSEEGIPLHEVVYALQLVRENMLRYVRDEGLGQTPLELYAEEELERGADRVFDSLIYYVVRGYERALRGRAMTSGSA
jgi:hypothetical protein